MHWCLKRSNPVDSHIRRHFHRRTIDGDAELDDAGVLVADGLRLQSSSCDVGNGVPRRVPRRRGGPLLGWCRRSLPHAAGKYDQDDDHGGPRSGRAPPTGPHGSRIEPTNMSPAPQRASSQWSRWYIAFRPSSGPRPAEWPAPVAQGIEHRPPEAGARVRISPGAPSEIAV